MVIKKICVIGVTKVYVNTITVSKWNFFRRRCCCEKSVSDFSHCSESAMQRFIQCKFNCRLVQQHGCCLWLESEPKDDLFLMLQFRLFFPFAALFAHLLDIFSIVSQHCHWGWGGGHMSLINHAERCHLKPTGGLRCVPVMVQRCLHSYGSQTATVLWFEKSRAFRSSCSVSWLLTEFLKSNQS